ncbi:MAG: fimbrillin family protein [Bacteroidales bacterium]|nr:fimbrillin family protein [Bacteroidales bacterium]
MTRRIILIAAIASSALLTAGCAKLDNPAREQNSICFRAGCSLLREDATKAFTPLTSEDQTFNFHVFGTKTVSGTRSTVFNGDEVKKIQSNWQYSPIRFWDSNASRYEFLGIAGPSESAITLDLENPLSATVTYNPTKAEYDLMAACYYRSSNAQGTLDMSTPVELHFEHFLSAVNVKVTNDSPTQEITLLQYGFRNLCTEAEVRFTFSTSAPQAQWQDLSRKKNTTDLLLTNDEPSWNMMIPQDLNTLSLAPLLMIQYRVGSEDTGEIVETPIRLSNITTLGGNNITQWEAGKKYTYNIHIRYGGGITVHVITTEWDEVKAGTPGLIVS